MTGNSPVNPVPRGIKRKPVRMSPLPLEWMDPMSWRLPSGKALAEFALQSGFLAPLIMGGPMGRTQIGAPKKSGAKGAPDVSLPGMKDVNGTPVAKPAAEVPAPTGNFREDAGDLRTGRLGSAQ